MSTSIDICLKAESAVVLRSIWKRWKYISGRRRGWHWHYKAGCLASKRDHKLRRRWGCQGSGWASVEGNGGGHKAAAAAKAGGGFRQIQKLVGGGPHNPTILLCVWDFWCLNWGEEPWKGKFIGGKHQPEWIQGDHDLKSKCEFSRKSDDFGLLKAIDLILELGVNANLNSKAEHMIKKKVILFSPKLMVKCDFDHYLY